MKKILEYHGIMDIEQTTVARPESNVDENSPDIFATDFNQQTDQMVIEAPKLPQSYLPDALIPHIAIAGKILKKKTIKTH
jgi:hypothetical protein